MFQALTFCHSEERLTLKMSALKLFIVANSCYQLRWVIILNYPVHYKEEDSLKSKILCLVFDGGAIFTLYTVFM